MQRMKPYPPLLLLAAALSVSCGGGGGGKGGGGVLSPQVVASNLSFPTALRFAPNGDIIFTEKSTGNVRRISGGTLQAAPMFNVGVEPEGERGLLGLALDPDYATNKFVYIFYSKANGTGNEVLRFTDDATPGTNPTVIVPNLPSNSIHDGGRLEFGPDGKLYVTLGDIGDPANSQNNNVPTGKVLRYNSNGTIPADNPIAGNPLFSKGHRNCFGLAIDQTSGTVFVSENGPGCDDEVNRLQAGGNFGWRPGQPCGDADAGFLAPLSRFGNVIAPTGIAVGTGDYAGSLLMGSFNDNALRQIQLSSFPGGSEASRDVIYTDSDAIIDVTMGPDGNVYVATGSRILRLVR